METPNPQPNTAHGGVPIRVMIVDDHPTLRMGIAALVEQAEDMLLAGEAESGAEALERVPDLLPEVVLLDCQMDDLRGEEVLARLREQGVAAKVLAYSAFGDQAHVLGMLQAGAEGYALKTEPPQTLLEAIRAVAGGKSWLSPSPAEVVLGPASGAPPEVLSARELEVARLAGRGLDNDHIAAELSISSSTVKNHLTSIYDKLKLRTRAELVAWAWEHGLVKGPGP
jgi:DNA-binding NarL/FixJ family response regulator